MTSVDDEVDYECELAFVIGKKARNVSRDEAMGNVLGYMPFHDVSARTLQTRTAQWTMGKAPDTFAPMGPALVTRDEVPDPHVLGIRTRVNGETLQDSNTSQLIFSIPGTVAELSSVMALGPGDVIATGTPPGVGFARKPPIYLKPGDVVEIEIDGLGTLRNPVVAAG
ncbi:MAG: fumarylacetoacetate hydrolase family protein, partial [Proteobacteria bacterium]|nr:fumarylacetoacetate hydrolase family protein [Pseudomonadota bacterium]